MSSINREYLLEQFRLVEDYLRRARAIASRPDEEYFGDPNLVDASIRQLTVLFETCHNISKHLVAGFGWRASTTKAETFEILAEHGVLAEDLVEAFRAAARFRNLVIYQTAMIQNSLVLQVLRENVDDFERFLASVAQWLETQEL